MKPPRPVRADDSRWLVAVAELPLSARPTRLVEGSIVVVTGEVGWGRRLRRAVEDGAVGVVVADPRSISVDEMYEAARSERSVPIVIDRPRLRADVAADARATAPAVVQIELSAHQADLGAVLRDGIGWGRILAGGSLELVEARATARGMVALLQRSDATAGGHRGTVTVLATRGDAFAPWIRATVLGVDRTEVVMDGATSVSCSTADGVLRMPTRFESSQRLALRRVIDATESSLVPGDLADLDHDSRLAMSALAARSSE